MNTDIFELRKLFGVTILTALLVLSGCSATSMLPLTLSEEKTVPAETQQGNTIDVDFYDAHFHLTNYVQ